MSPQERERVPLFWDGEKKIQKMRKNRAQRKKTAVSFQSAQKPEKKYVSRKIKKTERAVLYHLTYVQCVSCVRRMTCVTATRLHTALLYTSFFTSLSRGKKYTTRAPVLFTCVCVCVFLGLQ